MSRPHGGSSGEPLIRKIPTHSAVEDERSRKMAGPDGRAEQGVPGGGLAGFLVAQDADEQAVGHDDLVMEPRLWSPQQQATTPSDQSVEIL